MRGANVEVQFVHQPRHQGQLFGWTDGTADAGRIVLGRLPPGVDVLERFGQIKFFQPVVENHAESGPRQLEHLFRRQSRGGLDDVVVQRRVVPPVRGDRAEFAHVFVKWSAGLRA